MFASFVVGSSVYLFSFVMFCVLGNPFLRVCCLFVGSSFFGFDLLASVFDFLTDCYVPCIHHHHRSEEEIYNPGFSRSARAWLRLIHFPRSSKILGFR